jgi:hypothetical protein
MTKPSTVLPRWTIAAPFAAWIVLGAAYAMPGNGLLLALVGVALCAAVFTAVHHAEVVAHRVGEPFGTLVLAVAVTVIEVALIVSVMLTSGPEKAGLARDTVFAAVMIVCNGIVGICLLVGGIRHLEQDFQSRGAAAALAVLASLSVLTLVMPNFTTASVGPILSSSQLAFAGISSLVLYGVFVFVQTVRHRDYFLAGVPDEDVHAAPPSAGLALVSGGLLLVCLVAVVLLAKVLSPVVETAVQNAGAAGRGGYHHRRAGAAARRACRRARGARRPPAEQPESRARIGAGKHRAHHSNCRRRVSVHRSATRARHQRQGNRAARADPGGRHAHAEHRSHDDSARRRAPVAVRGVSVPVVRTLKRQHAAHGAPPSYSSQCAAIQSRNRFSFC